MAFWFSCKFALIVALFFQTMALESINVSLSAQTYFRNLIKVGKLPDNIRATDLKSGQPWHVSTNSPKQINRSRFLDNLFRNYDRRLPPTNETVFIESSICLNSLDSISELSFSYDMGIFLRLRWQDPRLQFDPKDTDGEEDVIIDGLMYNLLWMPDLFVVNERKASLNTIVLPNRLIRLFYDGLIMYSSRYYFTTSCAMQLRAFPFDNQFCHFRLQSYAYPHNKLSLFWAETPLEMPPRLLIAQFSLDSIEFQKAVTLTSRGNYSTLVVTFHLVRHIGFYILQIYVPSILTVLTAMTAFWIDPLAVPARVTIGVFTTLIMADMEFLSGTSLPTVSYVKAIDVWILVCTLFVFTALVEYALANILVRQKPLSLRKYATSRLAMASAGASGNSEIPATALVTRGVASEDSENIAPAKVSKVGLRRRLHLEEQRREILSVISEEKTSAFHAYLQRHRYLSRAIRCFFPFVERVRFDELSGLERCSLLDATCRRIFSLSFLLFNVVYWSIALIGFNTYDDSYHDNTNRFTTQQE